MPSYRDEEIMMEGVEIKYRDFSGKVSEFNKLGYNLFTIIVPDDKDIDGMIRDGWNVRWKPESKDADAEMIPILEIRINMKSKYPPKVVQISEQTKKRVILDEDALANLDYADIVNCDINIGPNHYKINGKEGVRAYLRSMWVTIHEDPLDLKYGAMDMHQSPNDDPDDYNE